MQAELDENPEPAEDEVSEGSGEEEKTKKKKGKRGGKSRARPSR